MIWHTRELQKGDSPDEPVETLIGETTCYKPLMVMKFRNKEIDIVTALFSCDLKAVRSVGLSGDDYRKPAEGFFWRVLAANQTAERSVYLTIL